MGKSSSRSLYQHIYAIVREIPPGKVSTYGRIAQLAGACTPRLVGYALHALPEGSDVPWHRIINSRGRVSLQEPGYGGLQRVMLESEGIVFTENGMVELDLYGWP